MQSRQETGKDVAEGGVRYEVGAREALREVLLRRRGVVECISVCIVLAVWEAVADFVVAEPFKLPSPSSVLLAFYEISDTLPEDILVSFMHFGIGICMGAAVGITIGATMGLSLIHI